MFQTLAPANNGQLEMFGERVVIAIADSATLLTWLLPDTTSLDDGSVIWLTSINAGDVLVRDPADTETLVRVIANRHQIWGFVFADGNWQLTHGPFGDVYTHLTNDHERWPAPLKSLVFKDGTEPAKSAGTTPGWVQFDNKSLAFKIPANATLKDYLMTYQVPLEAYIEDEFWLDIAVSKGSNNDTLTLDAEIYGLSTNDNEGWANDVYTEDVGVDPGIAKSIPNADIQIITFRGVEVGSNLSETRTIAHVITLGGTNDQDDVYFHDFSLRSAKRIISSVTS